MKIFTTKRRLISFLTFVTISMFIYSCTSDEKDKKVNEKIQESINEDEKLTNDFNKAKQIFYALPSPIETTMLIKRAETTFDGTILNPIENSVKYNTSKSKALNLGIYGADLSYASLFDQTQTSIKYLSTSKTLAEELGLMNIVDKNFADRLESNVNNRDSCMEIISEIFTNSNSSLKENGRPEIATMIIVGGWIEGLYIATQLTKKSQNNNELIDRIVDQKISLNTLINLLEEYKDSKSINSILADMYSIKSVYDEIQIVSSKIEPITDNETKITTLKAKTDIFMSDKIFNKLCTKVDSIRSNIIQ
ncbi:MAG: hypothetical protein DRJ01_07500 [Bacteroidetes bacterium]|nr:MAG: hypothetical protein DRJ01_07500 [Bacteroidota bacterium]